MRMTSFAGPVNIQAHRFPEPARNVLGDLVDIGGSWIYVARAAPRNNGQKIDRRPCAYAQKHANSEGIAVA